nr:arginine--tRNA ligase [Lachnospiraceae bacterium]
GESDVKPYIQDMLDDLVKRGVAHESQGALVVDIAEEGDSRELPPCLVRKSDGAAIYATSDLATILDREKLYHPDQYIYLADKRQELHFTQIFRAAKKAGYVKPETRMDYIGFGTMNGKDGKPFKTRQGGVMRLEYLLKDVEDAVYAKIQENRTMEDAEEREAAKKIGLAAVKYGDLSNQASQDYVFDMERFTSFEGNTGPYILYTMVRIKSILAKYQETGRGADCADGSKTAGNAVAGNAMAEKVAGAGARTAECCGAEAVAGNAVLREYSTAETELMLAATRVTETIERAAQELAPQRICQYIYELSNAFNSFYHENKILAEEDAAKQAQWIALITLTLRILETCTGLLGFEAPERM